MRTVLAVLLVSLPALMSVGPPVAGAAQRTPPNMGGTNPVVSTRVGSWDWGASPDWWVRGYNAPPATRR
jgi:hypothetical protein